MLNILVIIILLFFTAEPVFYLPVKLANRKSTEALQLTGIGEFGLIRKERPGIPAHYHTGIDIKRPNNNYEDEPIFPVTDGVVISKRVDGAYAQLIIEHKLNAKKFWTVYEHIAGIRVNVGEPVTPASPIARFMNRYELNKHGWQFDHFHFEVLKIAPAKIKPNDARPDRYFSSYTLVSYTKEDLKKYFHHPIEFFKEQLQQ